VVVIAARKDEYEVCISLRSEKEKAVGHVERLHWLA